MKRIYESKRHLTRKMAVPYFLGRLETRLYELDDIEEEIQERQCSDDKKDELLKGVESARQCEKYHWHSLIRKELDIKNTIGVIKRADSIIIIEFPHENTEGITFDTGYDEDKKEYYLIIKH